jgi:F0F1-type ATP synthase membrane subunit a
MIEKIIEFIIQKIPSTIFFVRESRWSSLLSFSPIIVWLLVQVIVIVFIIFLVRKWKNTKFWILVSMFFDQMYEFFEEIVWEKERKSIKIYVITLFFVIFTANMISYFIDLIRVVFVDIDAIAKYIQIPTTDFNFNIALAVVSVVLMLFIQVKTLRPLKFILEYIPITGKWILDIDRWNMPLWQYYPAKAFIKIFDIAISLFVWLLDIVWLGAKILSLSARLYGNMLAWGILLSLLVVWVNGLSQSIASADFPVLAPLILYAQWLLVAVIQAFVFPLLVAIFIKIAKWED